VADSQAKEDDMATLIVSLKPPVRRSYFWLQERFIAWAFCTFVWGAFLLAFHQTAVVAELWDTLGRWSLAPAVLVYVYVEPRERYFRSRLTSSARMIQVALATVVGGLAASGAYRIGGVWGGIIGLVFAYLICIFTFDRGLDWRKVVVLTTMPLAFGVVAPGFDLFPLAVRAPWTPFGGVSIATACTTVLLLAKAAEGFWAAVEPKLSAALSWRRALASAVGLALIVLVLTLAGVRFFGGEWVMIDGALLSLLATLAGLYYVGARGFEPAGRWIGERLGRPLVDAVTERLTKKTPFVQSDEASSLWLRNVAATILGILFVLSLPRAIAQEILKALWGAGH
jgi:hypothetical protein